MPESSKKVTEEVVTASKNNVKITLEEYNELQRLANRPIVRNVTTVLKTNAQNAADNQAYGVVLIVGGVSLVGMGAFLYWHGKKHSS